MNTQETKQNVNNTDHVLVGSALDLLWKARELYGEYLARNGKEEIGNEAYYQMCLASTAIYNEWEEQRAIIKQQQTVA